MFVWKSTFNIYDILPLINSKKKKKKKSGVFYYYYSSAFAFNSQNMDVLKTSKISSYKTN